MISPALFAFVQQQGAPAGAPSGISGSGFIFQIVAILLIFWFVLIRPQQRERKRHDQALLVLKKGDEVVTAGGIIAEVVHVQMAPAADGKEAAPAMTDRVTVRSGDSKLIVERGRIAKIAAKQT
jgi:preprotein translocase subunit YajC